VLSTMVGSISPDIINDCPKHRRIERDDVSDFEVND